MLNLIITGTGCLFLSSLLAYSVWLVRSERNFTGVSHDYFDNVPSYETSPVIEV